MLCYIVLGTMYLHPLFELVWIIQVFFDTQFAIIVLRLPVIGYFVVGFRNLVNVRIYFVCLIRCHSLCKALS